MRLSICIAAFVLTLMAAASQTAAGGSLLRLFGADWTTFGLPDKAAADFIGRDDGSLEVRADGAVGFLYREVSAAVPDQALTWRWRVDQAIPATDLSRRGRDDRPLAVHLWFTPLPDQGSFWGTIADIFGQPRPGYALTYVWGGTAARGARFDNPYLDDGVIVVLRPGSAATGTWYEEHIDIRADFRRVFGFEPPELAYIAISADTDDLAVASIGRIADLRLRPALSQPAPDGI